MNRPALTLALLLACGAALAQYKVVGPDGRVTYTDRPPPADARRVEPLVLPSGGAAATSLPAALRAPMQRFPVTLYAGPQCAPCDAGRELLRARGVPFAEKRVDNGADAAALQALSGSRNLPQLTIGSQRLQGLMASEWHSYLDAAGYPKATALPAGYQAPVPTPLAPPPAPKAPPAEPTVQSAPPPPPPASGIRF